MARATNKPYTEYYLVGTGNQGLSATGGLFDNVATNAVTIADGQLGIIHARKGDGVAYGDFITAGNTIAEAPVIKIVQGTANSADFSALHGWHYDIPAFVSTPEIWANSIQRVATYLPPIGTYSALAVSGLGTPAANTRYTLNLKSRSVRKDRDYGGNVDQTTIDYTTGASTSVATLLNAWGHKMNMVSKMFKVNDFPINNRQWLALAFNTIAADAALAAYQVGDSVDVFVFNGVTYSITLTKEMVQTLHNAVTEGTIPVNAKIIPIDITTPSAAINALLLIGLDHTLARATDLIYSTKVRLEATIGSNIAATITEVSSAVDDKGAGRLHKLWYNQRAFGQTGSLQLTGFADTLLLPPNYISESLRYVATSIDFYYEDVQNNDHIHNQTRVTILLPVTDDSATTGNVAVGLTVTTSATTTVTGLNAALSVWLASNTGVVYNGDAVSGTVFV